MNPTLLIRADDSTAIGVGHAMRCLALAQEWRRRGGRVVFAQAEGSAAFRERLAAEGIESAALDAAPGSSVDAGQTVDRARACTATWIVADGYRFGPAWQAAVKGAGSRLLVLDDREILGPFSADMILNQNAADVGPHYAEQAPGVRTLLGPRHALLRREFLCWGDWRREIPDRARKVLVTFGGSDPANVTAQIIQALGRFEGIEATVVVGGANPHRSAMEALAAGLPFPVRFEVNSPRMPELMAWADVAVTAAGSTSWELAFMGLPALQCVLAPNQAEIAAVLEAHGATVNLGEPHALDADRIASTLQALLNDGSARRRMSESGRRLVDGHGAARVAAALGAKLSVTLVSDRDSWLNADLPGLQAALEADGHQVRRVHEPAEIEAGDVAFLLSLGRLVAPEVLRRNANNLVVHESALPQGRGWSPLTWQVLEGKNEIPVTLLEAVAAMDAGDIYARECLQLRGDELVPELRAAQAAATIRLCRDFVARYPFILAEGRAQSGVATVYPRRRPADSRLDPDKTLKEQFNLLRVCDPVRYPAFFELAGRRYEVRVSAAADRANGISPTATVAAGGGRADGFTLLLTGAGGVAAPGLIGHLCSKGVRVLAADMNPRASGLLHADRGFCIPAAGSPQFLPAMRAICREESVDVVVPLVDEELMPLQELATDSLSILTPRAGFIQTCLDKHRLSRELTRNSIPGPRTFLASEDFGALAYPLILKPRTGRGSRGVVRIESPAEMERALENTAWKRDELIVQEFIDGPEFTVSVVVWRDGAVQAVVPKEIIVKKGVTQMAVTRRHPGIEMLCQRIQTVLHADGPFNVQLRLDPKSGDPLLFEINPRFSTTVTHTMAAGVDELYGLALQAVHGAAAYQFGGWREDLVLRRRSVDEFIAEADYLVEQRIKLCDTRS